MRVIAFLFISRLTGHSVLYSQRLIAIGRSRSEPLSPQMELLLCNTTAYYSQKLPNFCDYVDSKNRKQGLKYLQTVNLEGTGTEVTIPPFVIRIYNYNNKKKGTGSTDFLHARQM